MKALKLVEVSMHNQLVGKLARNVEAVSFDGI